eukprot:Gregarina_sp_Pseudo_9__677@NODE_1430_length_1610_cov_36_968810_g1328_i0_p2_GENE_NODE_1430_length_1610_cov_36_968810_g1328_i0NODE_1430_length_1610_cov_36_968810_g1328_i0_p2_ORF_typecomplete_len102_score2_90OpgC_C/PF10129_9/0_12_NODE_1430_length_1610_cov_36_968810_g1328_i010851390
MRLFVAIHLSLTGAVPTHTWREYDLVTEPAIDWYAVEPPVASLDGQTLTTLLPAINVLPKLWYHLAAAPVDSSSRSGDPESSTHWWDQLLQILSPYGPRPI